MSPARPLALRRELRKPTIPRNATNMQIQVVGGAVR